MPRRLDVNCLDDGYKWKRNRCFASVQHVPPCNASAERAGLARGDPAAREKDICAEKSSPTKARQYKREVHKDLLTGHRIYRSLKKATAS